MLTMSISPAASTSKAGLRPDGWQRFPDLKRHSTSLRSCAHLGEHPQELPPQICYLCLVIATTHEFGGDIWRVALPSRLSFSTAFLPNGETVLETLSGAPLKDAMKRQSQYCPRVRTQTGVPRRCRTHRCRPSL